IKHAQIKSDKPVSLFIDHRIGGGANVYLDNIISEKKQFSPVLLFSYNFTLHCFQIQLNYQSFEITRYFETVNDVFAFLQLFNFEQIFYNNLVSFQNINQILDSLVKLKFEKNAPLIITIHDYLPVCQSFTLLNHQNNYCQTETNDKVCENCIKQNKYYEDKSTSITQWRNQWEKLLEQASEIICFSKPSKEIILK